MTQKTREEILAEVTSDHLPQMFEIELSSNSKSDESSSSAKKTKVNIVTWNILNQCKAPNTSNTSFSNNPWDYEESQEDFEKRLDIQANQLLGYKRKGVDIFCLQECSEEAAEKIKKKLNESGGDFEYKTFKKTTSPKKPKQSYTFYNKGKFNLKGSKKTLFSLNKGSKTNGIHLGLAITFEDTTSKQNFVVENVHGLFDRVDLVEENSESLKEIYSDIPVISVGDYNIDASKLSQQEGVKTFACNLATNFDAAITRGEGVKMTTENKCYDMAHIILPKEFSVDVKATYQYFTEYLEQETETIEIKEIGTIDGSGVLESSQDDDDLLSKSSTDFLEVKDKKSKYSEKSTFVNLNKFNNDGFYDFINNPDDTLKQVPVAITGSTNNDLFWKIGGGGMNRNLKNYLKSKKGNALENANQKLEKEKLEKKLEKKDAIGTITLVDLELEEDAQIQTILYSASPDLDGLDKDKSKNAMIAFGEKFRNQLNDQGIKELCLPLYSGGIYRGSNEQEKVAEWLMEGWFLAETKNLDINNVNVYLGHKCLVDAVKKNTSKFSSTSTESEGKKKFPEETAPKERKKVTFANQFVKKNLKDSSQDPETLSIETQIKEKNFLDPDSGENLSAEDVAIRKVAGSDEESAKKVKAIWSKKESGKESVLEYAANSVLNKAKKAAKNDTREVVKEVKKSQEAWYKRFTRTDFEQVDLSETFRTVFVHCTFDENCVLPKDSSSIDPKYFSNCKFSKVLMDKPENKALKSALENAGMKLDGDSSFYKIGNVKRERYADKTKEGKPNPNFKAIESFQLISNYKDKLNKTK